jgi:vesicle-fusing ATPase
MSAAVLGAPTVERAGLLADLERVRGLLQARLAGDGPDDGRPACSPALADVAARTGMSEFERDVLLLAAAVQLDGQIAALVGRLHGDGDVRPTFGLAMAVLPQPHWDALAPDRPLRRWRLVELAPAPTLVNRPMTIDEHVLHLLTGVTDGCGTQALADPASVAGLTAQQQAIAAETARAARAVPWPVRIVLAGDDPDARTGVAQRIAAELGLTPLVVRDAALVGADPAAAALLVDRAALLADRLPITGDAALLAQLRAPVVVALGSAPPGSGTALVRTVALPGPAEQLALWQRHVPEAPVELLRDLAQHYRLTDRTITAIGREWRALAAGAGDGVDAGLAASDGGDAGRDGDGADGLRRLVRERARTGLGPLATRLEPGATWDDLVLPAGQQLLLQDLVRHVRHRALVYDTWGFGRQSARGLGVTALFTGESGTGKTLAAEVIAAELGHDLYRIDLASVVSKYIGETEKNLRAVFDAAQTSGAVLLFDEADALFGRRSDVKDSHDRYANLEVAYLLQRMESYRGVAILTTNLRATIDRAFLRRLRFVVTFPFPDEAARESIWRRAFPAQAPLDGIDPAALARLQVSGGAIRAIALSAAFAAAHDGLPIGPAHVLRAAEVEYAKADRPLRSADAAGLHRGPR